MFKKITYDKKTGKIEETTFSDEDRYICYDINTNRCYSSGMGLVILNEMYPITMPYLPKGKIKIFTEDFKYHKNSAGDFDTVGVLYFKMPDDQMVEVKRFFKEDPKTGGMVEIGKTEYFTRKKKWMDDQKIQKGNDN